jgi:hypothetical protein
MSIDRKQDKIHDSSRSANMGVIPELKVNEEASNNETKTGDKK